MIPQGTICIAASSKGGHTKAQRCPGDHLTLWVKLSELQAEHKARMETIALKADGDWNDAATSTEQS